MSFPIDIRQREPEATRAKTIFSVPFTFDVFQEYLCKDGLIVKMQRAVETL